MRDQSIFALFMRKLISKLANSTPGVVYYPKGWPAKINGVLRVAGTVNGRDETPLTTAAISMACAMQENLPEIGDGAEIRLAGVTHGANEIGDFLVTVKRI